ncbi:CD276 antigen [Chanos chanos]|uniref:CD276 antigen n=1 Tax=Chanos chanos TaxID=29144 RepID=A0A6J2UMY2_CHACN|nr:CD276 antigen [Chanos chanos]XP_030621741.1 CD276 antigen [Chanos chanos]
MTMLALLLPSLLAVQALGALEVQVPEVPVVALHGMDTTLNCTFSGVTTFNLSDISVFWQLSDTKRSVHSYMGGQDQLTEQDGRFANRTSMFPDQLTRGNASLLLRKVRVVDEGSYTCFVRVVDYSSAALILQVAARYTVPEVMWDTGSNPRPGDEVALTCLAYRGYPEAEVYWQDGTGRNLTDNVTISQVANDEGLFNVRSVLTVTLEPNSTYTCRLTNQLIGQESHASVIISAQSMVFPPVALWVTVGLAVCLLGLLIALAAVCGRKIKESCEEMKAAKEAKELEEDESKTAMTPLKNQS